MGCAAKWQLWRFAVMLLFLAEITTEPHQLPAQPKQYNDSAFFQDQIPSDQYLYFKNGLPREKRELPRNIPTSSPREARVTIKPNRWKVPPIAEKIHHGSNSTTSTIRGPSLQTEGHFSTAANVSPDTLPPATILLPGEETAKSGATESRLMNFTEDQVIPTQEENLSGSTTANVKYDVPPPVTTYFPGEETTITDVPTVKFFRLLNFTEEQAIPTNVSSISESAATVKVTWHTKNESFLNASSSQTPTETNNAIFKEEERYASLGLGASVFGILLIFLIAGVLGYIYRSKLKIMPQFSVRNRRKTVRELYQNRRSTSHEGYKAVSQDQV